MNKRIKEVRENAGLTQEEFGKRIGSARNTIANYETGNRKPSNAVITSICREFNINEEWLQTGKGEMLKKIPPDDEYMEAARSICLSNDEAAMNAVVSYWKMSPEFKKIFWDKLLEVAEIYKRQISASTESEESATMEPMTVEEAEAEYIKSRLEIVQQERSSASNTTAEKGKSKAVNQ